MLPPLEQTLIDQLERFVSTSNNEHIGKFWRPEDLWGDNNHRGLVMFEDGLWALNEKTAEYSYTIYINSLFSKEELIKANSEWGLIFEKIDNGLKPYWRRKINCTCGALTTYGERYKLHTDYCDIKSEHTVINNDGRDACYKCGAELMCKPGWTKMHTLCPNPSCEWYNN